MTEQQLTEAEIISTFKAMRAELQRIAVKVSDLEAERDEHKLVMDTMKDLEPNRKCYRLINGILVEKTVEKVLPTLEENRKNIMIVIEKLAKQFSEKEKKMSEFQEKYQIRIQNASNMHEPSPKAEQQPSASNGLLV